MSLSAPLSAPLSPLLLPAAPGMAAACAAPALAVALSGGPDSMALLWLVSQLNGPQIHALTIDHGLRSDSAAEAERVGGWVKNWPRVQHHILTRSPAIPGRIMERARNDRYALMAAYCRDHQIPYLLTAHHRDDQGETFLFRLAKGSGLDGLAAIQSVTSYNENLTLLRPLLDVPKEALIATCAAHALPYVTDPTNLNPSFARNRLRAAMDILASEGLNMKRLALTAARLGRARQALDFYADRAFAAALLEKNPTRLTLDMAVLLAEPVETQRRVLQRAITHINPPRAYNPRMEKLEDIAVQLFTEKPFPRTSFAGTLIARPRVPGPLTVTLENPNTNIC